uniref:Uncharacterized protein n=1 Tax=Octopus bimaculoides TaxID=37653 RepID=A0A0L8GFT6_OCTBM
MLKTMSKSYFIASGSRSARWLTQPSRPLYMRLFSPAKIKPKHVTVNIRINIRNISDAVD